MGSGQTLFTIYVRHWSSIAIGPMIVSSMGQKIILAFLRM